MKLVQRFISGLKTSLTACIEQEYHKSGDARLELQDEADLCLNAHQTRYTGLQCDRWKQHPFPPILSSHDQGGRSIPSPSLPD